MVIHLLIVEMMFTVYADFVGNSGTMTINGSGGNVVSDEVWT